MTDDTDLFPDATTRDIYTVSRLNRETKAVLENAFPLVWVEGEVSNLSRPASGHLYFSLKDSGASVRCALFKGQQRTLKAFPRDGLQVLVRARVTLYEGRGEYQLVVHYLEEAGEGALRRALETLKTKLAAQGLFDPAHKRPLPRLPRRIGVVTSPTGAAIRDILTTLGRRFPAIPVLIYPVPVQGDGAADQIAAALRLASGRRECDVLILARGGGSLEDLWAFNEEVVARAVYDCEIPVVCGVGHEIDFSIADLVADQRAPTPTAAAELLSPDRAAWSRNLAQTAQRLMRLVRTRLADRQQTVDYLSTRLAHPGQRIIHGRRRLDDLRQRLVFARAAHAHRQGQTLAELAGRLKAVSPASRVNNLTLHTGNTTLRLSNAVQLQLERARARLQSAAQRLQDVSPLGTLARGFAIVRMLPGHRVVRNALEAPPGSRVEAMVERGILECVVEKSRES